MDAVIVLSSFEDLVSTWNLDVSLLVLFQNCYIMFTCLCYFQVLFTILADSLFFSLCILFSFGLFLGGKGVGWEGDIELNVIWLL